MKKSKKSIYGIKINRKDWVLDGYKEPIKKLENGLGWYGVVVRDKSGEYVRSYEDGLFYKFIQNGHVKKFGYSNVKEYKRKYGIAIGTPLCGKSVQKSQAERGSKFVDSRTSSYLKQIRKKANEACRQRKGERIAMEIRNERGTCPDQLIDKIKVLANKINRTPSTDDFKIEYDKKYMGQLYYYFGSWKNAVKLAGFEPLSDTPQGFSQQELLERLRLFFENNGYTPLTRHFGHGILPHTNCFYRYWKTLNAARLNAGIPLVMSLSKSSRKSIDCGGEI